MVTAEPQITATDTLDADTPRNLQERTGRHVCISCLRETPADEYFRNDHICDSCTEANAYPLASTS